MKIHNSFFYMNSKYHRQNFFILPIDSREISLLKRLPAFFSDYEYYEQGDFGILYRRGLDHNEIMNEYIEDFRSFLEDKLERLKVLENKSKNKAETIEQRLEKIELSVLTQQKEWLKETLEKLNNQKEWI